VPVAGQGNQCTGQDCKAGLEGCLRECRERGAFPPQAGGSRVEDSSSQEVVLEPAGERVVQERIAAGAGAAEEGHMQARERAPAGP
jgi:hypothetical protein